MPCDRHCLSEECEGLHRIDVRLGNVARREDLARPNSELGAAMGREGVGYGGEDFVEVEIGAAARVRCAFDVGSVMLSAFTSAELTPQATHLRILFSVSPHSAFMPPPRSTMSLKPRISTCQWSCLPR